jgi:deoxyribodipyrimidine photo-lyase
MRGIVWFRGKDLRIHDHPALDRAAGMCRELIPVFVLSPEYFGGPSAAAKAPHRLQFLLESLEDLAGQLAALGSRLLLVHGPANRALPELVARTKAEHVFAIGACEPQSRARDAGVARALSVPLEICGYETLRAPGSIRTGSGGPFQVYTPFARALLAGFEPSPPLAAPRHLPRLPPGLEGVGLVLPALRSLGLKRNEDLQRGGERAAISRLKHFIQERARRYDGTRDRMDLQGTSRLSADLHFGTLSVRRIFVNARDALHQAAPPAWERYRAELLWREFSHHTLFDRPELLRTPFRRDFEGFPWLDDERSWLAWTEGRTGYPIVDAAARQLLAEGFVHNRARMIAASFLAKQLALHYARGEAHYMQWLTDGDAAQNNMGWQWCAGSGCDAQPYFRIFNPIAQGERYDPDGDYVRKYVPELAKLPARYIHAPFRAPSSALLAAGVKLGSDYPEPIVELDTARQRFLMLAAEHLGSKRAARASTTAPSSPTCTHSR